jgi:hypothetical protein
MKRFANRIGCFLVTAATLASACRSRDTMRFDPDLAEFRRVAIEVEYPDLEVGPREDVMSAEAPNTLRDERELNYWELSLEETMRIALANSQVIRNLGGVIVSSPAVASTVGDVAIVETDPRFGIEAALAAFDAQLVASLYRQRDDLAFNNVFFGGGASRLNQHNGDFALEINKTAATGTRFALRNTIAYSRNNSPINLFPGTYTTVLEGEFRHPLLQGGGIEFNRIAGPNATPGNYRGVLLARIGTDVALADFEINVRDYLRSVEVAYWELYFAYQQFHTQLVLRDSALETWRYTAARTRVRQLAPKDEAAVREQYYLAKSQAENALNGTPAAVSATTPSAVAAGVFALERRLRYLMGLPPTGGELIRPSDLPLQVDVVFDWTESLAAAMTRREELRRQRWQIESRELELVASRNFLKMRLDLVGRYRWRGFGDNLLGNNGTPNNSAYESLFTDDLEGWTVGAELTTPVGNRIGHLSVRNAELRLARERAIYREQELQIAHELSNAVAELARSQAVSRTNLNRSIAAHQSEEAERSIVEKEAFTGVPLAWLQAQRLRADADVALQRSLTDYTIAVSNVHLTRGTLLDYYSVGLTEGPWSPEAYYSAAKQSRRYVPRTLNYCVETPCAVSEGPYEQLYGHPAILGEGEPVEAIEGAQGLKGGEGIEELPPPE